MTVDRELTAALVAEHAAIYAYGVFGGRLDASNLEAARQGEIAHRDRCNALSAWISDAGATAPAAEPAYALPFAVVDQASAVKLAIVTEERVAEAWRAALPVTQSQDRKMALDALIDAAQRSARWRRIGGISPSVRAFPGKP